MMPDLLKKAGFSKFYENQMCRIILSSSMKLKLQQS